MLLFLPPENIRKPKGFLMFSGGMEKQDRAGMSLSELLTSIAPEIIRKSIGF